MTSPAIHLVKSVRDQVSAEEWQIRVDLAACYRLMAHYGMTEMIANHISMRLPGSNNEFLLNPYGMLYEQMTASSMIRIDVEGKVLFNATDYGINQAGYVIHSAIHKARHDVGCVIHTHTLPGMTVSAMKTGLLPLAQSAMRFLDVAYHDFEGVAIRLDEQERLVASLGMREAMVLRNHGLLTVGPTIAECFNNMWRLERACQLQVMALSCNTELQMPSPESITFTHEAIRGLHLGLREWPALLRKLDQIDPSFRD